MERGDLAADPRPSTAFIFEDLIGTCSRPRAERTAIKMHQWAFALDYWVLQIPVVEYMQRLHDEFQQPLIVVTWHPRGFALLLHDLLWAWKVYVDETISGTYDMISPSFAVDPAIRLVYDPEHRFGYGFKCREWQSGEYV